MFSRLWGSSTKDHANNIPKPEISCCGNREKGNVKALPFEPPKPSPAPAADDSSAGFLPSGVADLGNAGLSAIGDLTVAAQDSITQIAAQVSPKANEGNRPEGPRLDAMRNKKTLQSFEDREHQQGGDELANIEVDSGTDSEAEELQRCAKSFKESAKKSLPAGGKKGRHGDDGDDKDDHMKSIRDGLDSLKAFLPERAQGTTGHGTVSRATSHAAIGGDMSMGHMSSAATQMDETLTQAPSSAVLERGVSTATMGLMTGPSAASLDGTAGEDEEEEDGSDGDDHKKIDNKYMKRVIPGKSHRGIAAHVHHLRTRMECQGIEEPAEAAAMEQGKKTPGKTLELTFLVKTDTDVDEKKVIFRRKPIGFKWDKKAPIVIANVKEDGHAKELDVQPGWQLKAIGHRDVTGMKYVVVHDALMKAVKDLPEVAPNDEEDKAAAIRNEVLTTRVTVTLETARNFQSDEADHFCVCQIPGKPHSRIQTQSKCVADTPDTPLLEWEETHELFDYQRGDGIEFAVYAREKVASVTGEDTSLGRVRLGWEQFSAKGFRGELKLMDPRTGQPTKTTMVVRIKVDVVPEKHHAIESYKRLMRSKLNALGVADVGGALAEERTFTSASDAVREGLRAYHKHSEALGKFMPFPGMAENGSYELEPEATKKLQEYGKKLDNSDPHRLWITTFNNKEEAMGNRDSSGDFEDDEHGIGSPLRGGTARPSIKQDSPFGAGAQETRTGVPIVFATAGGETKEIFFAARPLGVLFYERAPLKITTVRPDSVAAEKSVEKGWMIVAINGQDVGPNSGKKSYKEVNEMLQEALRGLPDK